MSRHQVTDTCPCGAKFTLSTNSAAVIAYRWSDWLTAHESCRLAERPPIERPVTQKPEKPRRKRQEPTA